MLKKDDPGQQMVYYQVCACHALPDRSLSAIQAGIGTYTIPQIATPFWANISKKIDMAVANNLNAHVMGM